MLQDLSEEHVMKDRMLSIHVARTANEIGAKLSHAKVISTNMAINRTRHDESRPDMECLHRISCFVKDLYRLTLRCAFIRIS